VQEGIVTANDDDVETTHSWLSGADCEKALIKKRAVERGAARIRSDLSLERKTRAIEMRGEDPVLRCRMNELEHLRCMWAVKVKRKTELIVPQVTFDGKEGSLNNDSWAFNVTYSFRDALDIKHEERKRNKKSYWVWTQGPILSFKEGDLVHSKDGNRAVKVRYANRMGWDSNNEEMYQGRVVYTEYVRAGNSFSRLKEHTCTQMQFLQLLIDGEYER
jgi:hypothetical protein